MIIYSYIELLDAAKTDLSQIYRKTVSLKQYKGYFVAGYALRANKNYDLFTSLSAPPMGGGLIPPATTNICVRRGFVGYFR